MNIVVLDGYTLNPGDNPWDEVSQLGNLTVYDRTPVEKVVERCKDAEIILTNKAVVSAQHIAELPKLRFISVLATGFNIVDIDAARGRGIPVSNVPVYGTDSVGQFVFAVLLELCHHVALHDQAVRAGEWTASPDWSFWKTPQVLLDGKKMGIVGFGRIGRRVGKLAHAFGMTVFAHDNHQNSPPDYAPFYWKTLEEIFEASDVISLHCPLTAENAEFVSHELIGRMKQGSFFINTSRGELVNERDLAQALKSGKVAGAALDVVSVEPIRADNPLLDAPNCIMTPHMAWSTNAARRKLMAATVDNIKAFYGGSPINVVNR